MKMTSTYHGYLSTTEYMSHQIGTGLYIFSTFKIDAFMLHVFPFLTYGYLTQYGEMYGYKNRYSFSCVYKGNDDEVSLGEFYLLIGNGVPCHLW